MTWPQENTHRPDIFRITMTMPQPTAAVLTPAGRGAIASIRVSGPTAASLVSALLQTDGRPTLAARPPRTIVFGRWGAEPGEELVASRLSNDEVEIHCHGGQAAVARIMADLHAKGCVARSWREVAPLASLPDAPSETLGGGRWRQSAAVALAAARTERTAGVLLDQYGGAGERALTQTLAAVERGERIEATRQLDELLGLAPLGLRLTQPWKVVLAGRPNVGKSSLVNALLGYRRAIVFDLPGTTRDVVTATTACDGWPVELSDTAGWRDDADALESQGIAAAKAAASQADLVLLVADRAQAWNDDDEAMRAALPDALLVWNKADLTPAADNSRRSGLVVSATQGAGLDELLAAIAQRLVPYPPGPGAAVPFTTEQVAALRAAREALDCDEHELARRELARLL